MSKLISRKHDKFSEATETSTKEFSWGNGMFPQFSFQHISKQEGEILSLELLNVEHGPNYVDEDLNLYMYLDYGELILNINHTKNIVLKPIDVNRTRTRRTYIGDYHYDYEEIASYSLTKEQLQMLCSAESIEYKLSGNNSSIVYEEQPGIKNDYLGKTYFPNIAIRMNFAFQLYAKALYNAVYDNSAYIRELKEVDKKILKKIKDDETKAAEEEKEAQNQAKTQKQFYIIWIIVLLMSIALLVAGIALADGKPFWFGLAGTIVSIAVLAFSH